MKRLLAAGFPRIFQISKCFRDEERGDQHLPEFTLLEWYRTGIDYKALMEDCKALILSVSRNMGMGEKITYQGTEIDLKAPWKRLIYFLNKEPRADLAPLLSGEEGSV